MQKETKTENFLLNIQEIQINHRLQIQIWLFGVEEKTSIRIKTKSILVDSGKSAVICFKSGEKLGICFKTQF